MVAVDSAPVPEAAISAAKALAEAVAVVVMAADSVARMTRSDPPPVVPMLALLA